MAKEDYANPSGPITVGGFIHRKPGMSEAEFYEYWHVKHSAVVIPWATKYGLINYRQFNTPSTIRKKWTEATGSPTIDCDGYAEVTFSSIEGFMSATQDPYYAEIITPDENKFWEKDAGMTVNKQGSLTMIGVVRDIIKDGKVVCQVKESL